jgi:hypothetical protein
MLITKHSKELPNYKVEALDIPNRGEMVCNCSQHFSHFNEFILWHFVWESPFYIFLDFKIVCTFHLRYLVEVTLQVGIHDLTAMLDFPKLDNFITYPRSIDQGTGHLVVYQIRNLSPLRLPGNNENFHDGRNA